MEITPGLFILRVAVVVSWDTVYERQITYTWEVMFFQGLFHSALPSFITSELAGERDWESRGVNCSPKMEAVLAPKIWAVLMGPFLIRNPIWEELLYRIRVESLPSRIKMRLAGRGLTPDGFLGGILEVWLSFCSPVYLRRQNSRCGRKHRGPTRLEGGGCLGPQVKWLVVRVSFQLLSRVCTHACSEN